MTQLGSVEHFEKIFNKIENTPSKVELKEIRNLREKIESLELEVSRLNVELTLTKFGTKNYKNFMTENFDINDYV